MGLWIIPNPDVVSILQSEIDRLAELYQARSFLPHITAARLPVEPPEKVEEALSVIAQQIDNYSIPFGDIELRPNPYQKMVIDLNHSTFFDEMSLSVDSTFKGSYSKREFHLSLLYGYTPNHLLESEKDKIFDRLPDECFARELAVVLLNGEPDEWRELFIEKRYNDLEVVLDL